MNKKRPEDLIDMMQCKPGYLYKIRARNAQIGICTPERHGFLIRREKFGNIYTFVEYHWDFDTHFGTAIPYEKIEKSPFSAEDFEYQTLINKNGVEYLGVPKEKEILKYLEEWTDKINQENERKVKNEKVI